MYIMNNNSNENINHNNGHQELKNIISLLERVFTHIEVAINDSTDEIERKIQDKFESIKSYPEFVNVIAEIGWTSRGKSIEYGKDGLIKFLNIDINLIHKWQSDARISIKFWRLKAIYPA